MRGRGVLVFGSCRLAVLEKWADGGGVGGVSSYSSRSLYLLLLRKGEQDLVLLSGAAAAVSGILYFF